jgi:hypothetical protein
VWPVWLAPLAFQEVVEIGGERRAGATSLAQARRADEVAIGAVG